MPRIGDLAGQDPRPRPVPPDDVRHADLDPRSVLQTEAEIRRLAGELNTKTVELIDISRRWARAKHTYDLRSSQAYLRCKAELAHDKPTIPEIEAHVEIEVAPEHADLVESEAEMKAVTLVCKSIIAQLDSLRSINKNAREAADYSRGEGR